MSEIYKGLVKLFSSVTFLKDPFNFCVDAK